MSDRQKKMDKIPIFTHEFANSPFTAAPRKTKDEQHPSPHWY